VKSEKLGPRVVVVATDSAVDDAEEQSDTVDCDITDDDTHNPAGRLGGFLGIRRHSGNEGDNQKNSSEDSHDGE